MNEDYSFNTLLKYKSYRELSATALISAGWLHGIRCGYLDDRFLEPAVRAFETCVCAMEENGKEVYMRVGMGYDVHRLVEGRDLIMGGVKIPYEKGLLGHSDADVLLHAISDALLGAAALGDIGKHFPDTADEYKGIDSRILLRHVVALLDEKGYEISNIDATIIMQRPKVASFIPQMVDNIAEDCGVDASQVNIKATTEEKLGFTGEGLGVSAHAVCLIYKK
jgi:2-C-methyl-D-erythritol 2,4-cyclodiphosphate synthase